MLDLYHTTRDHLIRIILDLHDTLADREQRKDVTFGKTPV